MKELYSFKRTKVIDDKEVTYRFAVKKPTRPEKEQMETVYSSQLWKAIKDKRPSAAMVVKEYSNTTGDVLSNDETLEYNSLQVELKDLNEEMVALPSKKMGKKKQAEEAQRILERMQSIQRRIVDLEMIRSSIFNNTAEIFARDKTIEAMLITFSKWQKFERKLSDEDSEEDFSELVDVFSGGSVEEKYKAYDDFLENPENYDSVVLDAIQTLVIIYTWYWQGHATTEEQFKELMDVADTSSE